MKGNTPARHRRDPIDLLSESLLDEIIEFVKLIPFMGRFVPVLALVVMSRPIIMAVAAIAAVSSAFLVNNGIPPIKGSLLGLVCLWIAIASAHIFNDFCDAEADRMNRRTQLRPLVLGLVKRKTALTVSMFLSIISLIVAFFINLTCVLLLAAAILLMFAYSAKLKQTQIGYLPLALAAFLIPPGVLAVYNPARAFCDITIVIGLAGFFFELVLHWSRNLSDVEGGMDRRLRTTSFYYGERKAASSILLSFIICLFFLIYLYRLAMLSMPYLLVTAIGGGLLAIFLVWLVFRPDPRNALISYFSSLLFISTISLVIIAEKALPTLTEIWHQFPG